MQKKSKNNFSIRRRLSSFRYAFHGIVQAVQTQHNMWIHIFAATVVIVAGILFNIGFTEWLFVILAIGFVLSAELFNSAIETLVDLVSPEENKNAGLIKDIAAGAVLIAAIAAAVIGIMIFVPRIIDLL